MLVTLQPEDAHARAGWARSWLEACRQMPSIALDCLAGTAENPARAVHGFRRAAKRWRALLRLAPPHLEAAAARLRRRVGRLRRGFGAARNAAVVAAALARFAGGRVPEAEKAARRADRAARAHRLSAGEIEALRSELQALAAEMLGWTIDPTDARHIAAAARRSYRKARRCLERDVERMGIRRLHRFRTAVVDLAYQLAFFVPAAPRRIGAMAILAEALRDDLGRVVDLAMVEARLSGSRWSNAKRNGISERVGEASAKRRRRAAARAERLFSETPKRFGARLARLIIEPRPRGAAAASSPGARPQPRPRVRAMKLS